MHDVLQAGLALLQSGILEAGETRQLRETLYTRALKNDAETAVLEQTARHALADSAIPFREYADAVWHLAYTYAMKGDAETGGKMVRELPEQAGLSAADLVYAWDKAGRYFSVIGECDQAVAAWQVIRDMADAPQSARRDAVKHIADEYAAAFRLEEAAGVWLENHDPLQAATVWHRAGFFEKSHALALPVLADDKNTLAVRERAFGFFLDGSAESLSVRRQYRAAVYPADRVRFNTPSLRNAAAARMKEKNYESALDLLEILRGNEELKDNFELVSNQVTALSAVGRMDEAAALAGEYVSCESWQKPQQFQMALKQCMLQAEDGAFEAAWHKMESGMGKDFTSREKADALVQTGRNALICGKFRSAYQIDAIRNALYVPEPKRYLEVPWSAVRVHGIDDFPVRVEDMT